jgi:prostaglandin-E synthase 1
MSLLSTTAFCAYAIFAVALCILLVAIDVFGGVFRARTKTTPNEEDAASDLFNGSRVEEEDPDGVARVMRAHRNALSNIVPFLILMWLYVALGATAPWVVALCGVFTAMRVIHAVTYIRAIQPWRTISFQIGTLCIFVTAIQVARAAVAAL